MSDIEFNFELIDPMEFDFEVENPIGEVRTLFIPIAGGGGGSIDVDTAMSDSSTNAVQNRVIKAYVDDAVDDATEIVYGTFTTSGDTSVTVSLTAAQIASYLTAGKRIVLRGTMDSTAVELPYIGQTSNGYLFGTANADVGGGTFYGIHLGTGTFPLTYYNVLYIGDTSGFLLGAENTSGVLTLDNANSDSWDVYTKTAMDTALSGKQSTLTFDSTPTYNSTNPVTSGGLYTHLQDYSKIEIEEVTGANYAMVTDNRDNTDYDLEHPTTKTTVSGTSVTQALTADVFYVFGEVTSLTVTLTAAPADGYAHEYHFRFTSGSTATTLTLPSGVTMPSGFTVEASKTYEISIVDNYGTYVAW